MLVAVGSSNRTKIEPVKEVFRKHFPEIVVKGVKVASEVSEQPKTDEEMYTPLSLVCNANVRQLADQSSLAGFILRQVQDNPESIEWVILEQTQV